MTNFEQHHVELEQLGDLIDGRLSDADRQAVETHLALCASCGERRDKLESLIGGASALPGELEPPAGLWEDVRSRIAPAPARSRQRWMLAAAAIVLVALSSSITALLVRRQTVVVVRDPAPAASLVVATLPAPVRSVDADYSAAIGELNESLAEHRAQLDPTTVAKVEASLRVIDQAINEARQALAADPSNLTIHDLLAASYERKLELLRRANALLPSS